jgi:predicted alpha/beta hydrolase
MPPKNEPAFETISVLSSDGRPLAATLVHPVDDMRGAIVLLGAVGAPRSYYRAFAAHAASKGFAVLLGDYRGCGDSLLGEGRRRDQLRRDPATLGDWVLRDAPAFVAAMEGRFPGVPLHGIGHSLGGQTFALLENVERFSSITVVTAGSGDLRIYPPHLRALYTVQLTAVIPLVAVFGYTPGWLGLRYDLPAGVVAEWSRWCRTRGYLAGVFPERPFPRRLPATIPLRFFDVADDRIAPPPATEALRRLYDAPHHTHRVLSAAELDRKDFGHFGPFRPFAAPVWDDLLPPRPEG